MSRASDLALRCYPPSWQERYGDELRGLARDGDTTDLLVGAARAWMRPAGKRTLAARRLSAVSTVHVSWCVAYVGALFYLKAVNDPPLPGLTTGASQPLWGLTKATFFLGWVLLLLAGTGLLARIALPAVRGRDWAVLRPMVPATILLVLVLGSIPVLGLFDDTSTARVAVVIGWLALGLALVIAGAIGPVVALRRSHLSEQTLRLPTLAALGVAVMATGLAIATTAQAGVLSDRVDLYNLLMMWGAVVLMAVSAMTSVVSVRRALRPG